MHDVLKDGKVRDQISGAIVDSINKNRIQDELVRLNIQDENYRKAVEVIDEVREFIGSPEKILGNESTKHGEIAEQVEVGVRRARQALEGSKMTATFDGVGRTAPEDYLIDGIKVQSKFINGTNNNLDAVLEHMEKYSKFGRDGSYYHIPKDEYELIGKIRNSENIDSLSSRTIEAIKRKIGQIEQESGRTFDEVVKPGVSKYAEVQKGRVHQTLDKYEKELSDTNNKLKKQINENHKPNLSEGLKAAGIATAVGATLSLTTAIYKKLKEGKKFYKGDFSVEDWKEVGIETAKGGVIGGISGASIYALTNYATLSAPFAGAIVSATKGIGTLLADLNNNKISKEDFVELAMVICSESAIVGLATAAGQTLIPIPVIGAVIGSIAGSILANALGSGNRITAGMIRQDMQNYLKTLDEKYKALVLQISQEFEKLGELTKAAFDAKNNMVAFKLSIELALAYGVQEDRILKTTASVDSFMRG